MLTKQDLVNLLSSFQSYLLSSGASKATYKNYSADLRTILERLPSEGPILSEHIASALEDLKTVFSEATIRRFTYSLKAFTGWLEGNGYNLVSQAKSIKTVQTVSDPVQNYISALEKEGASEKTLKGYKGDLLSFFSWNKPNRNQINERSIERVSTLDIKRYINFLRARNFSDSSIKRYLFSLRNFFKNEKREVVYDNNPVKPYLITQDNQKLPRWKRWLNYRPSWWHAYRGHPASDYFNLGLSGLTILIVGLMVWQGLFAPRPIDINNLKTEIQSGLVLAATPPRVLSFQGRLTEPSGTPVTSNKTVVFKIYDAESGGTLLWTSKNWSVTPDSNGIFSVCLGGQDTGDDCLLDGAADTAIADSIFRDNAATYLEITVAGEVLSPRQRIAASPYALNTDNLDGIDSTQFLRSDTSDNFTSGTLTTDSGTTLDINGTLAWGGATITETLNVNNQLLTNIGNAGTDFVSGGGLTLAGTLTANNQVLIPDGSAGSPSISFTNDTNTGFYRQGDDLISFVANGQNSLNVDGTSGVGRLLVGNGSPVSRFQIADDGGTNASGITLGSTGVVELYRSAANTLASNATTINFSAAALTVSSCSGCGGGSQTPWTSNIDADGFSLLDFGPNLTARAAVTIASTGAGNDIIFNSADTIELQDASVITAVNSANSGLNAFTYNGTLAAFDGTDIFRGLYLNYTNANHTGTSNTNSVNLLEIADIAGDAESELNAIKIGALTTPTNGAETAINIGAGWDAALSTPFGGFGNFGNVLDYSEAFDNAAWTKSSGTTIPTTNNTAPDNTGTADQITTSSSGGFVSNGTITLAALTGTNWTFSVWLKVPTTPVTSRLEIISSDGTPVTAVSQTVSVTTTWQRFYVSGTFGTEADTVVVVKLTPVDAGTGTLYAWGAQLEYGLLQPSIYTRTESIFFSAGVLTGASIDGHLRVSQSAYIGAYTAYNGSTGLQLTPNITPCAIFCASWGNAAGQDITINLASTASAAASLHITNPTITTGTLTTNYGIYIDEQNRGTNDYGIAVNGADTASIYFPTVKSGSTGILGTLANTTGANVTGINLTSGTITSSGTQNIFQASITAIGAGTTNGIFVDLPSTTTSGGTINGINIDSISTSNGTDVGLRIGTGWDAGLGVLTVKNGIGTTTPQELLHLSASTVDTAIQFEDTSSSNELSSGPNSTGTAANDTSNGGVSWTSPGNITASDDTRATVTLEDFESSAYLKATNFGFSIPTDANILGIKVEFERSTGGSGQGYTGNIGYIIKQDTTEHCCYSGGSIWDTTDTYETGGGPTYLWNTTFTPADINGSNFGFKFEIFCATIFGTCSTGTSGRVDHVRITVYYSLNWTLGIDQSDGGNFKLSRSGALGSSDVISVSSSAVTLGSQSDSTAHTFASTCSCLLNSAAGTFGSETNRDAVTSSVVYRGKLFVATRETDAAAVYRYDGGTTWTRVTYTTPGEAASDGSDATNIDAFSMAVWNDKLYIGSQTAANTGALYVSSTADTTANSFTLVQTTRGTFGSGLTNIDGIWDMVVYNGSLYLATQENNLAEIDRYDGGTTLTQVSNTTEGRIGTIASTTTDAAVLAVYEGRLFAGNITLGSAARVSVYTGVGTTWTDLTVTVGSIGAETNVDDITGITVYNGSLYVATGEANASNIYRWEPPGPYSVDTAVANWKKVNNTNGKVISGDSANIDSMILRTYNGRLYAGTTTAAGEDTGALYEYDGTPGSGWSLINGTRGTFGAQTGVNAITTMVEFNGTFYIGTDDGTNNIGSVYSWTKTLGNSFMLRFDSGGNNFGGLGFQDANQAFDNSGHHGTFFFTHGVSLTSGAFDLAEDYPTFDPSLEPGEIVSVDPRAKEHVKRAEISDKKTSYIGIVSTDPGFKLSQKAELVGGDTYVSIALSGRVPLRVTSENGPIEPGDLLTISSIPGVAMKANPNNPTIGKALEGYSSEDTSAVGSIMIFVDQGYSVEDTSQPNPTTQPFSIDSESNITVALSESTKFIWRNSAGTIVAFITDSGEAVFTKVNSLVGNFGKLVFGEAVVKKDAMVAGEASFISGQTEIEIESNKIAEDSLINLTPITKTNGLSLYIKEKKPGEGFVVALERSVGDQTNDATASATAAIKFNWFILNQE